MGWWTDDVKSMDDLFVHALRDICYAENQILKALPEMVDKASDPQLKQGLEKHLHETEGQVEWLREVFRLHNAEIRESIARRSTASCRRPATRWAKPTTRPCSTRR